MLDKYFVKREHEKSGYMIIGRVEDKKVCLVQKHNGQIYSVLRCDCPNDGRFYAQFDDYGIRYVSSFKSQSYINAEYKKCIELWEDSNL